MRKSKRETKEIGCFPVFYLFSLSSVQAVGIPQTSELSQQDPLSVSEYNYELQAYHGISTDI